MNAKKQKELADMIRANDTARVRMFLEACREFFGEIAKRLRTDEAGAKAVWQDWSHSMQPCERWEMIMGGRVAAHEFTRGMEKLSKFVR